MNSLGKYCLFIISLFRQREKFKVYISLIIDECILIGVDSVYVVAIVSTFIGAVSAIQTAYNLTSPLVPLSTVGNIVRDFTILENAPTFTCLVLAGKVGSSIAGGLGTMRITEQIDAIEVMGINSSSYLVLPKLVAAILVFPMLVTVSGFLSIAGGYAATVYSGVLTHYDFVTGLRDSFVVFNVFFALIKAVVFSFLITSISSYQGYYTQGGALEVGKSSTNAVTNSCIAILAADYIIAKLLL
ncbi:MAG: ABC transporter permease [Cytophagales bacterium]|nr:MAG: ABC transporter permease [Cytophagales bacterium]